MTNETVYNFLNDIRCGKYSGENFLIDFYDEEISMRSVSDNCYLCIEFYKINNPFKRIYYRFKYGSIYIAKLTETEEIIGISKSTYENFKLLSQYHILEDNIKINSKLSRIFNL